MKVIDYYKGFEGEPELKILYVNGGIPQVIMKMWIGFFDSIIKQIKPNVKGKWEGVPLFYHSQEGWYIEDMWKCENLNLFADQLKFVDTNLLDDAAQNVLLDLIKVINDSLEYNGTIYLEYD